MGIFTRTSETPAHRARPANYSTPRAITAAAAEMSLSDKTEVDRVKERRAGDPWQDDAWDYYDSIGEIKYAAGLIGAVMSRIRLYPAAITSDDTVPSALDEVDNLADGIEESSRRALKKLSTANGGVPGLLHDASINLFIAGECYLVQVPARVGSGLPESWKIKSVDELVPLQNSRTKETLWGIKPRSNARRQDYVELPRGSYAARIWRMHPRYSDEADSNLRAMLDLCDELLLLSRAARATARSRLNAGAFFVPDEFSVSTAMDGENEAALTTDGVITPVEEDGDDQFEEELIDAMTTPIQDESSASAVVPLLIRGPAEHGDKIRHIKFERAWDPQLAQRAEKVLERILAALDIPKDVVTGLANIKYSNAVQIEESLYKSHIEPLALLLCDALTVGFLHPVLKSMGYSEEQYSNIVVWYDPSAITTKPDRASAATKLYELHELSGDALRRANGFGDADKPDPIEVAQRIAIERGPLSEPVAEALLKLLIPNLMEQVRQQALATSPAPMGENVQSLIDTEAPGGPSDPAAGGAPAAPDGAEPQPPVGQSPPPGLLEP